MTTRVVLHPVLILVAIISIVLKPGGITSLVWMVGFSHASLAMTISGVHWSTACQKSSFLA